MADPFLADLESKGFGSDGSVDEDDASPPWLKKGFKKPSDPFAMDLQKKGIDASDASTGRKFDNTGPDVAGQLKAEAASAPTFSDFAKEDLGKSFSNAGHTIASGAGAVATGVAHPWDTVTSAPRRHEFERGVGDMVTAGLANKAAAYVDPENFGPAAEASDAAEAPGFRAAGNMVGAILPSPANAIGGKVAGAIGGSGIASTLAKGVGSYEGMAIPTALVSAPSGHRLEAAYDAATDPASIAMAGALPAISEGASDAMASDTAQAIRARTIKAARERAVKDVGSDITAADGPRAKVTDQKRIAEVNERLFDLTQENPELRDVWRSKAEKATPKLDKFMKETVEPRAGLYKELDDASIGIHPGDVAAREASPVEDMGRMTSHEDIAHPIDDADIVSSTEGGIPLRDIVNGYRKAAQNEIDPAKGGGTFGEPDAARLNARADQMIRVYGKAREPIFDPSKVINEDGMTAGEMIDVLGKRPDAPGVPEAIAQVREMATTPAGIDMDARVPSLHFRREVTQSAKAAEQAMGGLEGTARHEALNKLYEVGGDILDKHIDESGMDPDRIAQLRKMNDDYFLLHRARTAIESRGWKEQTRPGFHIPHSVQGAIKTGSIPTMAVGAMLHPSLALPIIAGGALLHGAPAIASKVNWKLANMDPLNPSVPSVPPEIAARAAETTVPAIAASTDDNDQADLARQALQDPEATAREKARALQILRGQ